MDSPSPSENPVNVLAHKIANVIEHTGWHAAEFHARTIENFGYVTVNLMSQDKMTTYASLYASVSFDLKVTLTVSVPAFNGSAEEAAPYILAFTQVVALMDILKTVPGVSSV